MQTPEHLAAMSPAPPAMSVAHHAPPYRPIPDWVRPPAPPPPPKPAPFRPTELAVALGVVALCDVTLWSGSSFASGGFGAAALLFFLPVGFAFAARIFRPTARLVVVLGLLAACAVRCLFDPTPGAVLSGLALVAAFGFGLRGRTPWVPEALASVFATVGKLPSRVGAAATGASRIVARTRMGKVSVLPVAVPLALSAIFAGVFALANPVVAHGLGVAFDWMGRLVGLPHPARVFLWGASALAACALLRPAVRLARGTESASADGEATPTSLLVARNALGALNVLFFGYNALDAAYLWSGRPPAGITTQDYAHQGAFWLTVALVMLTGVVGVMFRGPLAHDARAKLSRTLAYAWMAQGLVLAVGTYRRIAIHIAHSGLSDLRIVGILGTTLVVAGVVTVALKLRRGRSFTWLLRRQLDAFAVTVVLYAVAPTHLVSARVNVARIERGEYGPTLHTFRQSMKAESTASLLPLLHHHDVRIRQGVAALLEQERDRLRTEVAAQGSWRERDLASRRALEALEAATPAMGEALGTVNRAAAREVLLDISRAASEGRSIEFLLSIPTATELENDGSRRYRSEYVQ